MAIKRFCLLLCYLAIHVVVMAQQQDVAGSADVAGLPRMAGFYIDEYSVDEKGAFEFNITRTTKKSIEGKKRHYEYLVKEGVKTPTKSQIFLHYMNMAKKAGGSVPFEDLNDNTCTITFKHQGREIWAAISIWDEGENYTVDVVEK